MRDWMYRSAYSWPQHQLEVSCQFHTPAALPPGNVSGTHWIGGWVVPTAGLDDVESRKISPLLWQILIFLGLLTRIYNLTVYSIILLEKLIMDQLAKKISVRYGARRSITVFTIAHKRTCPERDLPFAEKHCSAARGSTVTRNQTNTVPEAEASVISTPPSLLPFRHLRRPSCSRSSVSCCMWKMLGQCIYHFRH
jgi:hypothetical protein